MSEQPSSQRELLLTYLQQGLEEVGWRVVLGGCYGGGNQLLGSEELRAVAFVSYQVRWISELSRRGSLLAGCKRYACRNFDYF
jgi:hypothetical protein